MSDQRMYTLAELTAAELGQLLDLAATELAARFPVGSSSGAREVEYVLVADDTGGWEVLDRVSARARQLGVELAPGGRLLDCPEPGCASQLSATSDDPGERIEHHGDGSHTWHPGGGSS